MSTEPGGIWTILVPPTEMLLGGICVHELEFWSVLTLPKSQSWHSDKPVSLPNFPGMHGRHEACPGLSWKNPIPQAWHMSWSVEEVKLPGWQSRQALPSTRLPAGQALHVVLPGSAVRPVAQASHGAVRFCSFEAEFSPHNVQRVSPVLFW